LRTAVCLLALLLVGACGSGAETTKREAVPISEHPLARHMDERYLGSLDAIRQRKYLRVLTSNNSFDYFIHSGHHGGYQYEMVKAFTAHLNRKYRKQRSDPPILFELLPVRSEELIPMLIAGQGDLIAARMTVTPERAKRVHFSMPYRHVDELIVIRKGAAPIRRLADLAGRRVSVRKSSSYYESLVAASRALERAGYPAIRIEAVDERLETERVLALVAAGVFECSVADSIVAETAAALFPGLHVVSGLALREDGQLAWATHPRAEQLQRELDEFLPKYQQGSLLGNMTTSKYFEDFGRLAMQLGADGQRQLSPWDDLLRRHATEHGFDWRLMAAVAYQESGFRQSARSRQGAVGVFQIKPTTAREPYVGIDAVEGKKNLENNIEAGIKYLAWIKARYFDVIPGMRERDRLRMTLAAYNAGPATLINARNRARRMGLDPDRWFRNVELALLAMRKPEPVKYVSDINQHFISYGLLGFE
jgi:membrane-bound lytic murein transglycosylase MltF